MLTRGLYVGRFQPFHLGHLEAIKKILQEVDELVVVIGSAQEARVDLGRVWIVPVPDVHLHMMWVSAVKGYTPKFEIVYSNEPLTKRLFIEAGYKVKGVSFYERQFYSSTLVRERMLADESWTTLVPKSVADFIKEIDGLNRLRDLTQSDHV
jgi:nicotinamide-nucleotide adenylyltransferase